MYVFLREAYGRLIAFLFGWTLFLVIDTGAMATLAVAFSSKYLPLFVPLGPVATKVAAASMLAALVAINYVGTRWGARVQNGLMLVKFGAVVAVVAAVFLFGRGDAAHFTSPAIAPRSSALAGSFGLALVASLWAYKGWEVVSFSAGEIENPQRNVPLGLLIGTSLVVALYLAANLAYLWVFPIGEIAKSSRIASDAIRTVAGPAGAALLGGAILLSIAGAANGNVLTAPRVFFAMARDGIFFHGLASVHPRFLTPHVSIVAMGAWAIVLTLTGTFEQLAAYVIFGQWIFFGLTVAAVIVLRNSRPDLPRPYRTWGYPATPIVFVVAALYISINALVNSFGNAMAGLAIILLGIPAYLYWKR